MAVLDHLEPKAVFSYFEKLSQIPRGSGNEKAVSDYIVGFAKERNLEVYQDDYNNVIIRKSGTKGYEHLPTVMLQGHLDMVCEKNMDKTHNFLTDPIELTIKDDFVMANGTTLGADNGIAVAYCLALLDSDNIPHPPLEAIFTTDEEVGLIGAIKLDGTQLSGKYFINLDSEEEGELLVSCAGGLKAYIQLPLQFEAPRYTQSYKVVIKGLKGGHSGMEIDKNRANSNILLGRLLHELKQVMDYDLSELGGGLKDNAIPREAYGIFAISPDKSDQFKLTVDRIQMTFRNEFKTSDPNITLVVEEVPLPRQILSTTLKEKLQFLLLTLPNGIQTMSGDIEGLVESSLNLGVIEQDDQVLKCIIAVRSSVKSLKKLINDQLKAFALQLGGEYIETADYPEWEYQPNSKLRELFVETYEAMYGKKPLIKAIHAGLECGVFAEKMADIDLISLGPDMFDVHTPEEKLSIGSTQRTWTYLLEVLKNFNRI